MAARYNPRKAPVRSQVVDLIQLQGDEHSMAKFCASGHQIEDTWEVCPYCQRAGYQTGPPAMTVKTRLDPDVSREAGMPTTTRRTVVLRSEEHSLNSSHGSNSYAVFCLKNKNAHNHGSLRQRQLRGDPRHSARE